MCFSRLQKRTCYGHFRNRRQEAHIVAREEEGPRGISPLTPEQRDQYDNLILMCSIHHKVIDDHPDTFPVTLLNDTKRNHENWVKQNLKLDNIKQREDEVYASYIDEFLKLADIENYKAWTSWLLSSDHPKISKEQYDKLRELINYIISRVWYKRYPDLENALLNFKNVLNDLLKVFEEHAEDVRNGEQIWTRKFYKIDKWDDELYNTLHGKYMYHVKLIDDLTLELTRAANYLFDKVRQQLVPSFRIKEGVLLIEVGPFMDMSWRTYRVEYKPEERLDFPYPGLRKFMEIRDNRDINWGTGVSEDYFPPVFD
jgi:hypothetical protein